jgi:predicted nuclease with TOPRIM domain
MDLQIYELTVFTNGIINDKKFKIETKKFGPFDSIRKATKFGNKKIDKIKHNLKDMKDTFNEVEFEVEFEYDFLITDITKNELG